MKSKPASILLVVVFSFSSIVFAQDRPQRMRIIGIHLFDREKVAEFLGLSSEQKKNVFSEIDELIKIYDPYRKEAEELAESMGFPKAIVTEGMRALMTEGMRNMSRDQLAAMRDKFITFSDENRKILEKYGKSEEELLKHLANIEKILDDQQKEKFNFAPPMGRQAGAQQPAFRSYLIKPTFKPVQRRFPG